MPVSSIILNENNLTQIPNAFDASVNSAPYNKFYLPITNGAKLKDCQIAIQKINMYYGFPNIDNTNYQAATIDWPVSGGYSTFSWNLTQNFNYASVSQLNVTGVSTFSSDVSFDGDINGNVTIVSTDTGSAAGPEFGAA